MSHDPKDALEAIRQEAQTGYEANEAAPEVDTDELAERVLALLLADSQFEDTGALRALLRPFRVLSAGELREVAEQMEKLDSQRAGYWWWRSADAGDPDALKYAPALYPKP